jgi:hypothetical protein
MESVLNKNLLNSALVVGEKDDGDKENPRPAEFKEGESMEKGFGWEGDDNKNG